MYKEKSLGFEVWVEQKNLGKPITQCMATFYYWNECLDYKEYLLKHDVDCVIRTLMPSGLEYKSEHRLAKEYNHVA